MNTEKFLRLTEQNILIWLHSFWEEICLFRCAAL